MESRALLPFRWLAGLAMALALVGASYWCVRLAWAAHLYEKDTPESVREAIRLVPASAAYKARLADLDPASYPSSLRAALELNPRLASGWTRLGLRAEIERDYAAAESFLLRAAEADNGYDPRWTLANFYFRRANWEQFWPWARRALEMAHLDRTPLFRLCWQTPASPEVILARAIPGDARNEAHYLNFLLATGRLEEAAPVARRLEGKDDDARLPTLLNYCDRLLQANDAAEAVRVWNGLSRAGLDPERGNSLTNGEFAASPTGRGFDWKLLRSPGVSFSRAPSSLRVALSGNQAERLRLLQQYLPLAPGRKYRLHFVYRAELSAPGTGLRWSVRTPEGELANKIDGASDGRWSEGQFTFTMPSSTGLALLSLEYARLPGTTRLVGSLFLRRVELSFAN